MKIAIFHDYFDEIGGAEITLLYLAKGINATIFTTNISGNKIRELGFDDVKIVSIGKVPKIKHLKQISTMLRFYFLKKEGFDLYILGGPYSIYISKKHKPCLWYCFSPLRGLYDLRYFKKDILSPVKQVVKIVQMFFDKSAVSSIQDIITPSVTVQKRVLKYYKRSSKIVYHPVSIDDFKFKPPKGYWLSVQRIDPYKRIGMQIEAFSKLPEEKLIIVGGASDANRKYFELLKKKAPKNVIFAGAVFNRNKLAKLYSNCIGLIATSKDEDFGMTPVEAMASGKPAIAPNEGGYKETIIDGVTGKLVGNIDVDKLVMAIKEVGKNPESYKNACLKQSKKFDTKIFVKKMRQMIGKE